MGPKVVETIADLKASLSLNTGSEASVGFVPTMGALHKGHASLVTRARRENDLVVVSVFVNPTQFNDPRDLEKYPRTREADLEVLSKNGADVVWFPLFDEIYADAYRYQVQETELSRVLCGRSRPGHFTGMLSVVTKLLQLVRPSKAYFGEKDFQQLELVRGLVKSFFIPTDIVACETARDEAGLALSSRNARLSPTGLATARSFARELARDERNIATVRAALARLPLEIDYLEDLNGRRFAAVMIEGVRLIDNRPLAFIAKEISP